VILVVFFIVRLARPKKRRDFGRVPHSALGEAQKRRDFGRVPHSAPGEAQKGMILVVFSIVRLARPRKDVILSCSA